MGDCSRNGGNTPDPSCDGCDSLTTSDNPYDSTDSWYNRQIENGRIPDPNKE